MSFTCKNCNTSLTAGQAAPVKPSFPASPSPAKKANVSSVAAILLFTGIGIMGLASAGCGNQSAPPVQVSPHPQVAQADTTPSPANSGNASVPDLLHLTSASTSPKSSPSGVLTFTGANSDGAKSLFDYNITTMELTDYGQGEDGYRAKNGTALVAVRHAFDSDYDLVVVSSDGKTRTKIVKDFQNYSGNFILSPDGATALYGTRMDDRQRTPVLAIHNVQTGDEKGGYSSSVGAMIPQDWTPDGRLLITPFEEQQPVMSDGKPFILNFMLVSKDYSHTNYANVDQPGAKPVTQIFDPRVDPSGKQIAFAWDDHIWVSSADGSGAKQVTDSDSYENWPTWSPDGKWLAFTHKDAYAVGGFGATWNAIYLMPADGNKHSMSDPGVKELKDKAGKGLICYGRITWR